MKWHSLLKNPDDLPQRINEYEESEDVIVIVRYIKLYREKSQDNFSAKFEYTVLKDNPCYYGHWKPNGEEGWRVRGKDYSDCGKFGGFDTDTHFSEVQQQQSILKDNMFDITPEAIEFIKSNSIDDGEYYLTMKIVGWAYYPNEEDFIEENKDLIQ